jgi:prepilin-type N-terminal cleavage/methylation domain-containing protein
MRRGYTLIEIILTIAITGILAIGMFKALEAITIRSEKAKALTTLSLDSQSALDQVAALLYDRAPMFLKGCDTSGKCESLEGTDYNKTLLTWYGLASESYLAGNYSGFVDMERSNSGTHTLYSPNTDLSAVLATEKDKWGTSFTLLNMALIFSGTFDAGEDDYNYTISNLSTGNSIILSNPRSPMKIYEKYNLVDSAYAITRKEDTNCSKTSNFKPNDLLLFYDYRPWNNETFCGTNAKVALLATNVNAFSAEMLNGTIRIKIDMNASIKGSRNPVRLSKQKVVF